MNIWLRFMYAYGRPGFPLSAPAMIDETRESRRIRDEGDEESNWRHLKMIKNTIQTRTLFEHSFLS